VDAEVHAGVVDANVKGDVDQMDMLAEKLVPRSTSKGVEVGGNVGVLITMDRYLAGPPWV
jgi:hypothetical protein